MESPPPAVGDRSGGVTTRKKKKFLVQNSSFPAHFQLENNQLLQNCKMPVISVPDCITYAPSHVTLKTGQLASRPGLRRDVGHPGKNGTNSNTNWQLSVYSTDLRHWRFLINWGDISGGGGNPLMRLYAVSIKYATL